MIHRHFALAFLALVGCAIWLPAFNGQQVAEGPLTLAIDALPTITEYDRPQPVPVYLTNSAAVPLPVFVELRELVDECRAHGATTQRVEVPAGGRATVDFAVAMGQGSHSALYPVHVYARFTHGDRETTAHAVQIVETDFSRVDAAAAAAREQPVIPVPAAGVLALATLDSHRIAWQQFGQDLRRLPAGWQGSEEISSTHFSRGRVTRGETRAALNMHPPYRGGAGTVFAEYRLRLPASTPLALAFFNAIRDHTEQEPASDGVTFRVWLGDRVLFERHTAAKTWLPGQVDLSAWAGQEILLRLECHPGPAENTVCDSAFWGDPTLRAGAPPQQWSPAERERQVARAQAAILQDAAVAEDVFVFELTGGRAVLVPGPNGLADAVLTLGAGRQAVTFAGMHIAIFDQVLGPGPAGLAVAQVTTTRQPGGQVRMVHEVRVNDAAHGITAELWPEQAGLRLKITSTARITDLALGRADRRATRVYYGHGYCIEEPGAFRADGGGHNLSTSHVGFEFDNGTALLTACDTPPDYLQVDPAAGIYALHTHPDATFTLVPSLNGAFDCAIRYRPIYDRQPAPAVGRKAGRFVFDLWGGRYDHNRQLLERCFAYGLTNSLALIHVWQRWGYDYRLPDIFPPLPSLGTIEELRGLGQACRAAGVLWGLHDNYIDIYPDATGFSYEHVTFTPDGRPRKAWLNEGRQAQSYQFRPDHVRRFLQRNLALIKPALEPTASFVDVWTSINAFDYFDQQGRFHSKLETLRCWGEDFALIRDSFAGGPATSEAGSDQLIGWLDGADCQFLQLSPRGGHFHNVVPCRDWSRVPWFDAVNHTRFSLHGVGYPGRYEGGRSRDEHGIESDDYLTAEILTGHALMIDLPGLVRGAVRKYWLAQDFIASIAADEIASVEYAEGDLDRLHIGWQSGAQVWVNRSDQDWNIEGRTLPPFGYLARNGAIESSIERIGGAVVEHSRSPAARYVNGRGFHPNAPLAIRPQPGTLEYLGGRKFRLEVHWQADQSPAQDLAVFYHFSRPTPGRYTDTEFYGGGRPTRPTSQWSGRITTGSEWTVAIPEGMPLGEYDVLVGLYDAAGRGNRARLLGDEDGALRYRIGKLTLEGTPSSSGTNITAVRLSPPPTAPAPASRPFVNPQPTNFRLVKTSGGLRLQRAGTTGLLVPLPDGPAFTVDLDVTEWLGVAADALVLHAVDRAGSSLRPVSCETRAGRLQFTVASGDYGYRMEPR